MPTPTITLIKAAGHHTAIYYATRCVQHEQIVTGTAVFNRILQTKLLL
jgi:hypothetical protein